MNKYKETKYNYDKGVEWHIQKSLSYNWKNQIEQFVKGLKGTKILDAGCGGGRDIKEFLRLGFDIEGIDYSEKTIEKCKKQYPNVKFMVMNLRMIRLPNKTYDGIWACASILNLDKKDVPIVLHEFKRILKKGGKLFVSVKEGKGERVVPDKFGKRFFSFFSVDEITSLVQKSGFKVNRIDTVQDSDLTGKISIPPKSAWICVYAESS